VLHTEIYRARPDVNCIVHTHPFYTNILTATGKKLLPITHAAGWFVGATSYFNETSELIWTVEQGRAAAKALGNNRLILMRNHGMTLVGTSVEEATGAAIHLELAAKSQVVAMSTGRELAYSSDAEVEAKQTQHFNPQMFIRLWAYLNRKYC